MPTAIETLLTSAGSVVTAAVGWMGTFLSQITKSGNELFLVFVLVPLVGLGVGLARRMLHV